VCVHARIFVDCLLMLVVACVQASQEDVRIQDGEEIAACFEDSLPMDSLALSCKMLLEKTERHLCLLCTGNLRSSFIRSSFRFFL